MVFITVGSLPALPGIRRSWFVFGFRFWLTWVFGGVLVFTVCCGFGVAVDFVYYCSFGGFCAFRSCWLLRGAVCGCSLWI